DVGVGGGELRRDAGGHLLPGLDPPGVGGGHLEGHPAHVLPRRGAGRLRLPVGVLPSAPHGLRPDRGLRRAGALGAGLRRPTRPPHRPPPQALGVARRPANRTRIRAPPGDAEGYLERCQSGPAPGPATASTCTPVTAISGAYTTSSEPQTTVALTSRVRPTT